MFMIDYKQISRAIFGYCVSPAPVHGNIMQGLPPAPQWAAGQ